MLKDTKSDNYMIPPELHQWLTSAVRGVNTQKQYESQINKLLNQNPSVATLDDDTLTHYLNSFIVEGQTSYHRYFALRHYLEFLGRDNLIKKLVRLSQHDSKIDKRLSFDEIKELISGTDDLQTKLLVMLQYDTACRINALLTLKSDNVKQDSNGEWKVTIDEKGGKSRKAYISKETSDLYLEYIKTKDNVPIYVFNTLNYPLYWGKLRKLSKRILGKDISSHWFRHSRAVHLFERGYSIFEIQRVLGHSSIESTRHYLDASGMDTKKILMEKEKPNW
jgi:integrase